MVNILKVFSSFLSFWAHYLALEEFYGKVGPFLLVLFAILDAWLISRFEIKPMLVFGRASREGAIIVSVI